MTQNSDLQNKIKYRWSIVDFHWLRLIFLVVIFFKILNKVPDHRNKNFLFIKFAFENLRRKGRLYFNPAQMKMKPIFKRIQNLLKFCFFAILFNCVSTSTSPIQGFQNGESTSIASLEKVILGGVEQWILIRGCDISKPLLLKLHGGPGQAEMATVPYNSFLEREFLVVEWDQRGAGKSYSSIEPESGMTIDQIVADTIELSTQLLKRFKQRKMLLVGHSWGSVLALKAAHNRPELFYAIATTGQIVSLKESGQLSHSHLLRLAHSTGNSQAVTDLLRIGAPPYSDQHANDKFSLYFRYLQSFKADWHSDKPLPRVRLMLNSPEYSLIEKLKFTSAANRSFQILYPQLSKVDLEVEIKELKTPIYFALGRYDYLQPSAIAERFLLNVRAPYKMIVWFENSSHFPFLEESEEFSKFLRSIPNK